MNELKKNLNKKLNFHVLHYSNFYALLMKELTKYLKIFLILIQISRFPNNYKDFNFTLKAVELSLLKF